MTSRIDRRSRERVVTRLPVRVRAGAATAEMTAETRDVSTNGVFLYTESRMIEGANIELVLILPPELTSGEKCWVCCHARVLRVEQEPGKDFGVAAEIRGHPAPYLRLSSLCVGGLEPSPCSMSQRVAGGSNFTATVRATFESRKQPKSSSSPGKKCQASRKGSLAENS